MTPQPKSDQSGVLLWRRRDITCECFSVAPDYIEIILRKNGVLQLEGWFADEEEAYRFSSDMLRHHDV